MTANEEPSAKRRGRITYSSSEIARLLAIFADRQVPITAHLRAAELFFVSRIRHVDPEGQYILIDPSASDDANAALLIRPRCTFYAATAGWHIEFVAADPQVISHENVPAIRLKFPEVLVNLDKRSHIRAEIAPQLSLHCEVDAGGVLSFDGRISDISHGGVGFLVYDPSITLEPGTVLRGCRIEPTARKALIVDLEVRYSELVTLPDGTRIKRSGCQFIDPPESLKRFVDDLLDHR
ncbi:MAG: flagellar brake protein [Betaproteobacteria bacterium]|nr:flagellar brake protein [Betaproteobacteria bacterium]